MSTWHDWKCRMGFPGRWKVWAGVHHIMLVRIVSVSTAILGVQIWTFWWNMDFFNFWNRDAWWWPRPHTRWSRDGISEKFWLADIMTGWLTDTLNQYWLVTENICGCEVPDDNVRWVGVTECHESQVQKSELVKITKYAATRISDIGFQNIHDYEKMYNLRPRLDAQLKVIACELPPDVLYRIALIHWCQPAHRYPLRQKRHQKYIV